MGFSVLKVCDVDFREAAIKEFEHGSGGFGDVDLEGAGVACEGAFGLCDASDLEEVDVGTAEDDEDFFVRGDGVFG